MTNYAFCGLLVYHHCRLGARLGGEWIFCFVIILLHFCLNIKKKVRIMGESWCFWGWSRSRRVNWRRRVSWLGVWGTIQGLLFLLGFRVGVIWRGVWCVRWAELPFWCSRRIPVLAILRFRSPLLMRLLDYMSVIIAGQNIRWSVFGGVDLPDIYVDSMGF